MPGDNRAAMTDLAEEQKLFQSIQLSPIAMVVTNPRLPDNPIVAINAAFTALTGYSAEEAVGRNCRFLAGADAESWDRSALREAVDQQKPTIAELLNYRKDGSSFRNAVMIAPLFDESGSLAYYVGSQMDVSEGRSATGESRRTRASELVAKLTPRQVQVLREMAAGLRNKQIARRLDVSEKTVKMHRASLLVKLGAPTSADAVRIAVEAGL